MGTDAQESHKKDARARDKDANPRPYQGLSVECTREFMTRDMNVTINPNCQRRKQEGF